MLGIDKNTVISLIVIVAGILLFNGMINIPQVGKIFSDYPFIIIGVAVLLLVFRDKIGSSVGN